MEVAAVIAVVLLAVAVLFQLALALGARFGRAAFGGQNPGTLPVRLRIVSGLTGVVFYPLTIMLVLAASSLVEDLWIPGDGRIVMWVLVAFFSIGALMNALSRSKLERLWAPWSAGIAVCCGMIATSI
jgi:hypothetical protein